MQIPLTACLLGLQLALALPSPKPPSSEPFNRGIKVPPELRAAQPHTRAVRDGSNQDDRIGDKDQPTELTAAPATPPKSHILPAPGSCATLSKIYSEMGGTSWANQTGWSDEASASRSSNGGMTCCNWFGVVCKGNTITALDLGANGLNSALSTALFALPDLERLSLRLNSITGGLPDSFDSLPKLKSLDVSDNFITGNIPGSLSTHSIMSSVHLSDNQLSGLAGFSGPSFANIMINNNAFSGMAISQLASLQRLTVNNNQMKGPLPDFSGATSMQIFSVANNSFTGPLFGLTTLPALQRFDVRNNTLSGPFPRDVSSLSQLSHLFLGGNRLSGVFPETPAPPALASCNALPNDLQGIPSQDTMNDLRSLASKCLQHQKTTANAPDAPGPNVNTNVIDPTDSELNDEPQRRAFGEPPSVSIAPSSTPSAPTPAHSFEAATPHVPDVPDLNAPEIPLPPGVSAVPIPSGPHSVPGPSPSSVPRPALHPSAPVPAIGSPAAAPRPPVPEAPPMSELFAAANHDSPSRGGTMLTGSSPSIRGSGSLGTILVALVMVMFGAVLDL